MAKEVIYPIFTKCASATNDPFWKEIYEDLSIGKCPYGISIHKNHLNCFIKGKEFSCRIEETVSCPKVVSEIDRLLRERAGILSDQEKVLERARVCRLRVGSMTKNKKDDWARVKKKMVRDTLLEQYVLENTHRHKLGISTARKILSMLIIGLMFKTITAKDIFYENGFIHRVEGFQFEKDKIIINKNLLDCKESTTVLSTEETPYNTRTLQSFWPAYLDEIKIR